MYVRFTPDIVDSLTKAQLANIFPEKYSLDGFRKFAHKEIQAGISDIIKYKDNYCNKSEDAITIGIVHFLSGRASVLGYEVHHDNHHNGHCDIVIGSQEFRWICEAKLYKGNMYCWAGFRQLSTRYLAGHDTCSHSSLLLYVNNSHFIQYPDIKELKNSWKSKIVKYGNKAIKLLSGNLSITCEEITPNESVMTSNGFKSKHYHITNSAVECVTYHYFIDLFHLPSDKK